jgi:putative DNA primase/helicase
MYTTHVVIPTKKDISIIDKGYVLMTKKKKATMPPTTARPSLQTKDAILRDNINAFVATHALELSSLDYQYNLSRLLCNVEETDTGNAIRFAARYGHLCKYVPEPDKWYIWTGVLWAEDTTGAAMQFAKQTAAYMEMEADFIPLPQDDEGYPIPYPKQGPAGPGFYDAEILAKFEEVEERKKRLYAWAKKSRSKQALLSMLELARSEPGITTAKALYDADDMLLNVRNGVLDIRTRELHPHHPKFHMSRLANVDFDPSADCFEWLKFIDKVTVRRPNIAAFLRQIAGMGITGERVEDIFVVFYGSGSNGKTVFQEVLREILGDYADIATAEMFMEKKNDSGSNDIAMLDGVRLLFKDETKQGRQLDEGMVKELTGGGAKKARFLFKEFFIFVPKFTAILSTNHRPRIAGTDNGIWRRVKEIPWEHNFEKDPEKRPKEEVFATFRAESSGILNWCLDGFADYKQNGVFIPPEIVDATDNYKRLSDVIGSFIEEECYTGPGYTVTKKELYTLYAAYMEENGSHPLNKPNFGEEMKQRGFLEGKSGAMGHYWKGIRARDKMNEPMQFAQADVTTDGEVLL